MATISEIREKLMAGEVVVMPKSSVSIFMQQCVDHPAGEESYKIEPHDRRHSRIYDPRRVKEQPHD